MPGWSIIELAAFANNRTLAAILLMSEKEKLLKESGLNILSSLISIPGVGQTLMEVIGFRSKLKQDRLNQFTELLENYFSNHAGIRLENFQTEEFSDLFEAVLKRVVHTKSNEKHKRFRDILINQLETPSKDIDDSEIYLELISGLTEVEIRILDEYKNIFTKLPIAYHDLTGLSNCLNSQSIDEIRDDPSKTPLKDNEYVKELITNLQSKYDLKNEYLRKMLLVRESVYFGISEEQFLFYKQRLSSKGLVVEYGVGAIGTEAFKFMTITEFGLKFIDFIKRK